MSKRMLEQALKQQVAAVRSPQEAIRVLHQFKASGGSQQAALRILEHLRGVVASEQEKDKVLELMDFVAGFCQPNLRIW